VYHSTLGLRVIKKKKKKQTGSVTPGTTMGTPSAQYGRGFCGS